MQADQVWSVVITLMGNQRALEVMMDDRLYCFWAFLFCFHAKNSIALMLLSDTQNRQLFHEVPAHQEHTNNPQPPVPKDAKNAPPAVRWSNHTSRLYTRILVGRNYRAPQHLRIITTRNSIRVTRRNRRHRRCYGRWCCGCRIDQQISWICRYR